MILSGLSAFNTYNRMYYSLPEAFTPTGGLADIYARSEPLNLAIGRLIESRLPRNVEAYTIKELASGGISMKWRYILQGLATDKRVRLILSDFSEHSLPSDQSEIKLPIEVDLISELYDLEQPLQNAASGDRLDAILVTYGFDSVWMQGDYTLCKKENIWHTATYSIALPDLKDKKHATLEQLHSAEIEYTLLPCDVATLPYGDVIDQLYRTFTDAWVNVPVGMIARVIESFERQLKPDGVFVIGDVVRYKIDQPPAEEPYSTSGKAAKFKIEDYLIASEVLGKRGLRLEFYSLKEVITNNLSKSEINTYGAKLAPFGYEDMNCITVISRQ
jgi:SAM-dependent methyltransferase